MDTYEISLPDGICLSDDWYEKHTPSLLGDYEDEYYKDESEEDELYEED